MLLTFMTTTPTRSLGTSALLCLLTALTTATLPAQTAPAPSPATAEKKDAKEDVLKLEAFSVTGTNIKRLDQEKVLPVTVFNIEQIEIRNALTPVEMLTALPQVTNIPLNESQNGGANSRGDNANVNLRGIGAGNTLVLLNGRRLAPTPSPPTTAASPPSTPTSTSSPPRALSASTSSATAPPPSTVPMPSPASSTTFPAAISAAPSCAIAGASRNTVTGATSRRL